jgi:Notch-like protein
VRSYACNTGYTLEIAASMSATCAASGTWTPSAAAPHCVPNACTPQLSAPTNGAFAGASAGATGDAVRFRCDFGYELLDTAPRVCQATGSWLPAAAPQCSNIDDCAAPAAASTPVCANGATCIDGLNSTTCICVLGYTGATCAVIIDECAAPSPCLNNATCTGLVADYTCACLDGYAGKNCDADIDDCAGAPCLNGATCVDELAGFTCACGAPFMGALCENVDCNARPGPACRNGASCTTNATHSYCDCSDTGHDGTLCEFALLTQGGGVAETASTSLSDKLKTT